MSTRSGGALLVDQLELSGVDVAFGVPGESYLAVLDALRDSRIRYVTCRHEGGAANMAEAYGKLTGTPGVCMVTRGPGATHASCGVHTAAQDATPLILFVGQVPRASLGRGAFQEVDYGTMFGGLAKWVCEIDDATRIPEVVSRAFTVAASGRPGPVVLSLPEDMLGDHVDADPVPQSEPSESRPVMEDLDRIVALLSDSERPLVVVGSRPWSIEAHADLGAWCVDNGVPVATSWRSKDHVDNASSAYVGGLGLGGDPRLAARLREADALLVIGADLGDIDTGGYSLLPPEAPGELIHVHPDSAVLGRVYPPKLAIVAGGPAFVAALRSRELPERDSRRRWLESLHADRVAFEVPPSVRGRVDLGAMMSIVEDRLPDDAIIAHGAGNFTLWAQRFYRFRRYPTQLAPESGAMGYGLPAAIAAKVISPERAVVCVTGDGDLLMTGQELATAVQIGANVVVIVVDNGMYGTIRVHQERSYPGRVSGTMLRNPDFVLLARAYGCYAEHVERTDAFAAALERALAADAPSLLHLSVDPEAVTPDRTLAEIRAGR